MSDLSQTATPPSLACYMTPLPPSPMSSTSNLPLDDNHATCGESPQRPSSPPINSDLLTALNFPLPPSPAVENSLSSPSPIFHPFTSPTTAREKSKTSRILYISEEDESDTGASDSDSVLDSNPSSSALSKDSRQKNMTGTEEGQAGNPTPRARQVEFQAPFHVASETPHSPSLAPRISRFVENIDEEAVSFSLSPLPSSRSTPSHSPPPSSDAHFPPLRSEWLDSPAAPSPSPRRRPTTMVKMWRRTSRLFVRAEDSDDRSQKDQNVGNAAVIEAKKPERPRNLRVMTSPSLSGTNLSDVSNKPPARRLSLFRSATSSSSKSVALSKSAASRPSPLSSPVITVPSPSSTPPNRPRTSTVSSLPSLITSSSRSSRTTSTSSPTTPASRVPLSPTIHTGGTISKEMKEILDDESRRLSEVAFM